MNIRSKNIALLFSCVLLSISCVDKYLPDSLDAFDRDVNFTTKLYRLSVTTSPSSSAKRDAWSASS